MTCSDEKRSGYTRLVHNNLNQTCLTNWLTVSCDLSIIVWQVGIVQVYLVMAAGIMKLSYNLVVGICISSVKIFLWEQLTLKSFPNYNIYYYLADLLFKNLLPVLFFM